MFEVGGKPRESGLVVGVDGGEVGFGFKSGEA